MSNFKIPSFILVFLFPLGIIAFVGTIIATFWAMANIEGFASILMLLAGGATALGMKGVGDLSLHEHQKNSQGMFANIFVAGAIAFYALMGMAIDQPGNFLYNKPLEWLYCPKNTTLERSVNVSHPLPGRTDMTQEFVCVNPETQEASQDIPLFGVIGVRFFEYVLIGYLLKYIAAIFPKKFSL